MQPETSSRPGELGALLALREGLLQAEGTVSAKVLGLEEMRNV